MPMGKSRINDNMNEYENAKNSNVKENNQKKEKKKAKVQINKRLI